MTKRKTGTLFVMERIEPGVAAGKYVSVIERVPSVYSRSAKWNILDGTPSVCRVIYVAWREYAPGLV